jgi:hypothetical protein
MADIGGYDFSNSGSPTTTWTITHNLGTKDVSVDAIILTGGNLEKAIPLTQTATDNNTVTITWSVAQEGKARVVGGGDD